MKDRFRFRVWDKQNREMKYDILDDLEYYLRYDEIFDVIQCTGLKDKNGKLIYEDDYLKNEKGIVFELVFEEKSCGLLLYQKNEDEYYYPCYNTNQFKNRNICEMEIVGNVYENKELLND